MRTWIKNPLTAYDAAGAHDLAGGIVVQDRLIVEHVGSGAEPAAAVDAVLDASACVLLPGLINTHHHFYQTLTRAFGPALNKPLFDWLTTLYPVWARLTPEAVDAATRLAACELLLSGCTTSVDHHYVFPAGICDAIDVQAAALADVGLRAVLTRGSMSLGDSAGGLPPDSVVQTTEVILEDSERLATALHDPSPGAMLQIALAPCSPFSVTPELMQETAALAARHDLLLHTHLAETEAENAFCEATFGRRPVAHMAECDWLVERAWFAHGIHFDALEIQLLGAAGCGISHCPSSNMLLASGLCPVAALEDAGVGVSLAVDGSASNDGSNLIGEARQALLLQRLGSGAGVTHLDALRWATAGGAAVLRRPELGSLRVGAAADLALFTLEEPRFSTAHDPLAALLLCGAQRARHVMVDGHWRVRDGELVGIDLAALQASHRQQAMALVGDWL